VTPEFELITEIPSCASDVKNDSESASENKNKNKAFGKKFNKESDRSEEIISKSPNSLSLFLLLSLTLVSLYECGTMFFFSSLNEESAFFSKTKSNSILFLFFSPVSLKRKKEPRLPPLVYL